MIRLFLLISAVLASLSSCSLDMRGTGTVHILSVACDYRNGSLSPLSGTIDDAVEVGECLRSIYQMKGYAVDARYMLQEGTDISENDADYPSAQNIMDAIADMSVEKNDLFVFYYSGHGDAGVDESGAYDGTGILAAAKSGDDLYTELDMDGLFRAVDELQCASVILIDACYSGNTADNTSPQNGWDSLLGDLDLTDTAVLTACQPTELSYVSSTVNEQGETERHSLFTIALLQALGWRHSSYRGGVVYVGGRARTYDGYLSYVPDRMDTKELEDRIMSSWYSNQQTPYFNVTGMDIYLVP